MQILDYSIQKKSFYSKYERWDNRNLLKRHQTIFFNFFRREIFPIFWFCYIFQFIHIFDLFNFVNSFIFRKLKVSIFFVNFSYGRDKRMSIAI